jgi:hypothetical protein
MKTYKALFKCPEVPPAAVGRDGGNEQRENSRSPAPDKAADASHSKAQKAPGFRLKMLCKR